MELNISKQRPIRKTVTQIRQNKAKKKSINYHWVHSMLATAPRQGAYPKEELKHPMKSHWRKWWVSFQVASWLGTGARVYFYLSILGPDLAQPFAGPVCAAGRHEFVCVSVLFYLEDAASLALPTISAMYSLSPPLHNLV